MTTALVIGGGPAGLMAAEVLADSGAQVIVTEAMPTFGRKFLMAGKSGLNLTMDAPADAFLSAYGEGQDWLAPMIGAFGPPQVQDWARALGQEVFTGSTGRVFPTVMKASPLLRAWLARLSGAGVGLRTRWRWTALTDGVFRFDTPDGREDLNPDVAVLALGGRSWPRLGSNGAWTTFLQERGIDLIPFAPSNMGLCLRWSDYMTRHLGAPLKNIALNGRMGEAVITRTGLEGALVYHLSPEVRAGKPLVLDLVPGLTGAEVAARLARQPARTSIGNALRKALRLDPAKAAVLMELSPDRTREGVAHHAKALPVPYTGPAPIDDAISTVGGVPTDALDRTMLRGLPGVFCAGEMIDWDAPTGGYLLTACFATGRAAGLQAADYAAGGFRIASART